MKKTRRHINLHSKRITGKAASADTKVDQGFSTNLKAIILQSKSTLTLTVTGQLKHTCIRKLFVIIFHYMPIPQAARFKAWVCDRLLAGIPGLNPAGGAWISALSVVVR